ncbi:MAG TPA: DUF1206 domain-containing protein [Candidatus Nanopelagicales bacterium]|nr:DUF1206 domain-containing protein [Candidatus Nanopelagicales bacterium]
MSAGTTHPTDVASDVADSAPMGWAARVGLTARAVVYLIMGWLAIMLATGSIAHVDQRGVLVTVLSQPFGTFLVVVMLVGFVAYALWRFSEAAFGVIGEPPGAGPRLKSFARGVAYLAVAWSAFEILRGARASQAGQQAHLAATVMAAPAGRLLLGLVGLGIVVAGLVMVHEGWSKKFMRYFGSLPLRLRTAVVWLGRIGTVSRGLVFAVAGALVVAAAWKAQPSEAGGIDVAVRTLLGWPFGHQLVVLLGVGLVLFGVYGLAEAIWRRVPGDGGAR